jgi:hypothetical protein
LDRPRQAFVIGRNGREERELAYDSITLGDHERDALLFGSTSGLVRLVEKPAGFG